MRKIHKCITKVPRKMINSVSNGLSVALLLLNSSKVMKTHRRSRKWDRLVSLAAAPGVQHWLLCYQKKGSRPHSGTTRPRELYICSSSAKTLLFFPVYVSPQCCKLLPTLRRLPRGRKCSYSSLHHNEC